MKKTNTPIESRGGYKKAEENLINQKTQQMGDENSVSCDRFPFPPSRHEKLKRARQRPTEEFTSYVSQAFAEKIVSWICYV